MICCLFMVTWSPREENAGSELPTGDRRSTHTMSCRPTVWDKSHFLPLPPAWSLEWDLIIAESRLSSCLALNC